MELPGEWGTKITGIYLMMFIEVQSHKDIEVKVLTHAQYPWRQRNTMGFEIHVPQTSQLNVPCLDPCGGRDLH